MTIIDILKMSLLGKKILVYEFDFKLNDKSPIQKRYYTDKEAGLGSAKRDNRMTYVGEMYKTIVDIFGDSDPYEGDAVYIHIDADDMIHSIGITVVDDLIIK